MLIDVMGTIFFSIFSKFGKFHDFANFGWGLLKLDPKKVRNKDKSKLTPGMGQNFNLGQICFLG